MGRRAASLFDTLILAIAESPSKLCFRPPSAWGSVAGAPHDVPNVQIVGFNTLLMNFVHEMEAKVIVRGLRAASDFQISFQMAGMAPQPLPELKPSS